MNITNTLLFLLIKCENPLHVLIKCESPLRFVTCLLLFKLPGVAILYAICGYNVCNECLISLNIPGLLLFQLTHHFNFISKSRCQFYKRFAAIMFALQ